MHPPLTLSKHPLCVEAIAALQACHAAHPWAKLAGACNDQKWALDDCFKAEVRRMLQALRCGRADAAWRERRSSGSAKRTLRRPRPPKRATQRSAQHRPRAPPSNASQREVRALARGAGLAATLTQ